MDGRMDGRMGGALIPWPAHEKCNICIRVILKGTLDPFNQAMHPQSARTHVQNMRTFHAASAPPRQQHHFDARNAALAE